MPPMRYAVVKCGDEWKVVSGRGKIGHFADREEATIAATGLCREAMDAGHDVELLTQHPSGELTPGLGGACGWDGGGERLRPEGLRSEAPRPPPRRRRGGGTDGGPPSPASS